MKACLSLAIALTVLAALPALPVQAETIHLKNGARVSGKIVKEDAEQFTVQTPDGRRKVLKKDVETLPAPNPSIALMTGVLVAGGGHIYLGVFDRAALYFGLGAASGAIGYFATRAIRPSSVATAAVVGLVTYSFPMGIGAWDAYQRAQQQAQTPKFRIDYTDESAE
jgi:hypothetical protein